MPSVTVYLVAATYYAMILNKMYLILTNDKINKLYQLRAPLHSEYKSICKGYKSRKMLNRL